ncbi:small membrane protein [Klebsiella oxytoca]|nr:small membrane protein [Klebsiella oxytoca]
MGNILLLAVAAALLATSVYCLYSYLKDIRKYKHAFMKKRR